MKTNQEYKTEALDALRGNWAPALVATIIYLVLAMAISGASGIPEAYGRTVPASLALGLGVLEILVVWPLAVGFNNSFRLLLETGDDRMANNMFALGFGNFLHNVWGMFLTGVFIFLWTLLFVIPGIVKSFSYAMTPFILVEHPELPANRAIDESSRLMKGRKFDLFWLYLSFIGWAVLCFLSLGIGFLWLIPYIQTSLASFYADVKAEKSVTEGPRESA